MQCVDMCFLIGIMSIEVSHRDILFVISSFFPEWYKRVIRNLTVHDAIAGISKLVLEIYLGIKELFIAGDTEVTIDDIKGFLQFPPNLEPEEIIFKEYLSKFSQMYIPYWWSPSSFLPQIHQAYVRLARCCQHRVQQCQIVHFYITLQRSFPDQGKFPTSLKAIWGINKEAISNLV